MASALGSALVLTACRGDDGGPPPSPGCTPTIYRVDRITLPSSYNALPRFGLDVDGDGRPDNAFDQSILNVRFLNPDIGDLGALATARVAGGDPIWRIALDACGDGVSRVQLDETSRPFATDVTGGVVRGAGGTGAVPISVLADPLGTFAPVAWLPVIGAAVDLHVSGGELDGLVGFAMPMPASVHDLLAPFAAYLTAELAAGTSTLAMECDQDHDGVCTVDELLTTCDGTINGQCWNPTQHQIEPDVHIDGVAAQSFVVGVHATEEP
jgi:hypothetical protein